jgi:hypothetical protein
MEKRIHEPRNKKQQDEYFEKARDYSVHQDASSFDRHNDSLILRINGQRPYIPAVLRQQCFPQNGFNVLLDAAGHIPCPKFRILF